MSKVLSCLLSVTIFTSIVFGQNAKWGRYEVATWGNFAQCAITHTFDNYWGPCSSGMALFEEKGFRTTFSVIPGAVNWDECNAFFAKGHEISNFYDTCLGYINLSFDKAYDRIITNVPGAKGITISYPGGLSTELNKYMAGRIVDGGINGKTPNDWYHISSKPFISNSYMLSDYDYFARVFESDRFVNSFADELALDSFADEALAKNGWAVYSHFNTLEEISEWDYMKNHLDYLYNNKDNFWVENFGNVVRYIKERDAVSIIQTDSTNYGFTIFVNDTLDNEIYNYPLTIRMLIPGMNWAGTFDIPTPIADGKKYIDVSQNGVRSDNYIVTEGEMQYVVFNVIPDGGKIKIMNLKTHENTKHAFLDKTAAPFCTVKNRMLQVNRGHFGNSSLSVGIFDINGRMLAKHNLKSKESSVTLDAGKISRSAFIVKISDGVTSHTQRFLPQF